jgi:catechol 2,3-dioxygenase-like lactoylglutathione lyase family enzyme
MARIRPRVTLAHVGIWTFDFPMMVDFYTDLFGLVVTDRGQQGERHYAFLTASTEAHHQLVIVSGRTMTVPQAPGGLNQVSFRLPSLSDLREFHERLAPRPVTQVITLTHGNAWSVYFHDPEANRIEVFVDTPWHMPQPFAREIDLSRPDDEILAMTEALCAASPDSRPMNEWRRWAQLALGGSDREDTDESDPRLPS